MKKNYAFASVYSCFLTENRKKYRKYTSLLATGKNFFSKLNYWDFPNLAYLLTKLTAQKYNGKRQ